MKELDVGKKDNASELIKKVPQPPGIHFAIQNRFDKLSNRQKPKDNNNNIINNNNNNNNNNSKNNLSPPPSPPPSLFPPPPPSTSFFQGSPSSNIPPPPPFVPPPSGRFLQPFEQQRKQPPLALSRNFLGSFSPATGPSNNLFGS